MSLNFCEIAHLCSLPAIQNTALLADAPNSLTMDSRDSYSDKRIINDSFNTTDLGRNCEKTAVSYILSI